MYDEAEKLFINAKAYDKLNQFYQVIIYLSIYIYIYIYIFFFFFLTFFYYF